MGETNVRVNNAVLVALCGQSILNNQYVIWKHCLPNTGGKINFLNRNVVNLLKFKKAT